MLLVRMTIVCACACLKFKMEASRDFELQLGIPSPGGCIARIPIADAMSPCTISARSPQKRNHACWPDAES